jgi:hypothetical protein
MGPYAGADYNLTLCPFQSQLQHIYQEQPFAESTFARVDFIPQSGTLELASGINTSKFTFYRYLGVLEERFDDITLHSSSRILYFSHLKLSHFKFFTYNVLTLCTIFLTCTYCTYLHFILLIFSAL